MEIEMHVDNEAFFTLRDYQQTAFERELYSVELPSGFQMFPLIHSADTVRHPDSNNLTADDILRNGKILPVHCDVFNEDLIYTYIGRAAYREVKCPCCFIIKPQPELLQNIFIFDTGAYYEKRYSMLLDNVLDVNLFRIPADADYIRKFIMSYFGDNKRYLYSYPIRHNELDKLSHLEEFSYIMLENLTTFDSIGFDDRCRTLENIVREPIDLRKSLQGILFPQSVLESGRYIEWIEKMPVNLDIMTYDDSAGLADSHACQDSMIKILDQYYQEKGYII